MGDRKPILKEKESNTESFIEDLRLHSRFKKTCVPFQILGQGGDGLVRKCIHEPTGRAVAMKIPIDQDEVTRKRLMNEVRNLKIVGNHEHVLGMLTYSPYYPFTYPAIFFPLCDLGDLFAYVKKWQKQETNNGRPRRIPELTVWKLFRDMALALDHLHNKLGTCYVHQDLKPDNILVREPEGYIQGELVPVEPIFVICDFARLVPHPTPRGVIAQYWNGTPEFSPPMAERKMPVHPSGDIWSLGLTIQAFALDIIPRQSRPAFIADRKKLGLPYPDINDDKKWKEPLWRDQVPSLYRPLNVSGDELTAKYDVPEALCDCCYWPFSSQLNEWYKRLLEPNPKVRITSSDLVKDLIPRIDQVMVVLRKEEFEEDCTKEVEVIQAEPLTIEDDESHVKDEEPQILDVRRVWKSWHDSKAPSYEGNSYGCSYSR
ncbi:kinase-like protein [Dothidotthia symphoricarpi CBS 119687]|uniref:non-specific serine/threonine protein kinase n=1 Tax=Dothidotthia symphoricarpi CBS 119687 TaxID=1392245 RepID=A0A6A6AGP0_9PLEO|nr:kinase-like protein [Dothidotthia symphoricarpi CBS 119687]KAF2131099.1 kinase-like protein [Dothidotthia symphoricarpi CBS 119687]